MKFKNRSEAAKIFKTNDPTELRDRTIGQIEKQYHIDRMRMIRKSWAATDPFGGTDSNVSDRLREIDFKVKLMLKTPPENFLDLDALTKKFNEAWERRKNERSS